MPTNIEIEDGVPDEENPEWTKERFARAKRFPELPISLQRKLKGLAADGSDDAQLRKEVAQIPLESDVMAALRATGPDWQKRAEEALREKFVTKAA